MRRSGLNSRDHTASGLCECSADLKGCSWLLALKTAFRLKVTAAAMFSAWAMIAAVAVERQEPSSWSCLWELCQAVVKHASVGDQSRNLQWVRDQECVVDGLGEDVL